MKSTIKLSIKLSSLALVATLAACGGGGSPTATPVAVLAPGIWNKTDNLSASTKFIGVVTTSSTGGDVWGWAVDTVAGTSKMFTGAVTANGENFETTQGGLLSYSSQTGWAEAASGKKLVLPKAAVSGQQSFVFEGPTTTYNTSIDPLWSNTAQLNNVNDWNTTWTLTEQAPDPLNANNTIPVVYSWAVSSTGAIAGTKKVQGQEQCTIKGGSAVTAREKAVVNVNVTYVCSGVETAYSGISFPLAADQGVINRRAVWMKRIGTNEFVAQDFRRAP